MNMQQFIYRPKTDLFYLNKVTECQLYNSKTKFNKQGLELAFGQAKYIGTGVVQLFPPTCSSLHYEQCSSRNFIHKTAFFCQSVNLVLELNVSFDHNNATYS